ncbi:MAG: ribosome-associated translation inhibitor RaiA [Bacteroidales bacterium]|nr:ribosome-associated translation inhibitor RaiA [Bacteroidales bacterium]MBQ9597497.1 ribosome-associated translation inhibitor RaiA [Bacteroidales bacterium]MCR4565266.1 ribosome-associated translation inhibitor RaiA [Bacteroidales bacterium]
MTINVQSIKFDADAKLLEFTEKKVSKLDKFYDPVLSVDVKFSLLSDNANKNVRMNVAVPGTSVVVERNANSFETAVNECVDILKEKLTRMKEKRNE